MQRWTAAASPGRISRTAIVLPALVAVTSEIDSVRNFADRQYRAELFVRGISILACICIAYYCHECIAGVGGGPWLWVCEHLSHIAAMTISCGAEPTVQRN